MSYYPLHPSVKRTGKQTGDPNVDLANLQLEHLRMLKAQEIYIQVADDGSVFATLTPSKPSQVTRTDRIIKMLDQAYERTERLAAFDTAEVAAGKNISGYLKGKRPLPKWAEGKVFPRSGSAITLFSVFVPNDQRILFPDIASNDKFWWPAVNGIVYCFRYRKDAEALAASLRTS